MAGKNDFNVLAIIGFILSLTVVFSIVGIILCIIAIVQVNNKRQRGMGLAIAGLVIGLAFPALLGLAFFIGAGLATFYGSGGIIGSGNVISQTYDLSGFDKIEIGAGGDLFVTQGDEYSVVVEAEDNLFEHLEVEVGGDELSVDTKEFIYLKNTKPIKVFVTLPKVEKLIVEGSGSVESETLLRGEELSLVIRGSGSFDVEVDVVELASGIDGSGEILVRGDAESHVASIAGSGTISSFDLITENARVRIAGSGDVMVFASEELDVSITGSGDVLYKGDASVSQRVEGSGGVRKIG